MINTHINNVNQDKMEENWLVIAGFGNIREANTVAAELKSHGIPCHTVTADGGEWMVNTLGYSETKWIYVEVREEDYDEAIDILQLDPITVEELQNSFVESPLRDKQRRGWLTFWAGVGVGTLVLTLLADKF